MMTEIKIYKSYSKALWLLCASAAFVSLGILLIVKAGHPVIGWISVLFFGLGIPISLFNLFDRRPQIIINEIGIFDRTIHKEIINWELIQTAYPISIHSNVFICLVVDENFRPSKKKGKFYNKVVDLNHAIGAQELNINLGQVKVDEIKLTEFILRMIVADRSTKSDLIKQLPTGSSNAFGRKGYFFRKES